MTIEGNQPASARTWPELLQSAQGPREILALVRDFIATWTPQELESLPPGCQPPLRFQEPEDVVLYTFTLSQVRLTGTESAALDRMWRFFMEATQRVGLAMSRATSAAATG